MGKMISITKRLAEHIDQNKLAGESNCATLCRLIGMPEIDVKFNLGDIKPRKKPGPKSKYTFAELKPGESLKFVWIETMRGKAHPAILAAERYQRATGELLQVDCYYSHVTITKPK